MFFFTVSQFSTFTSINTNILQDFILVSLTGYTEERKKERILAANIMNGKTFRGRRRVYRGVVVVVVVVQ